jgi:DNA replication and repair protein RecF
MRVETLYVCHFRNLEKQEVRFDKGINAFIGDNAEGKTSLLEALHVLIIGGSFRTHQLKDLLKHGTETFFIEAKIYVSGVEKKIALQYDGIKRSVFLDSQLQESSSSLIGNLLGVTASTEDHELVFGAPAERRRFLDEQIAQIDPFYLTQLRRYSKALSHRNKLLKRKDFYTIRAWEEQLARAGSYIMIQRKNTTELLSPKVESMYRTLFPAKCSFSMEYCTQPPPEEKNIEEWYLAQYAARREQEAYLSSTLVGPHRDDILYLIDNKPLKSTASLGQARSVVLALRLAEWELLFERSHEEPIFLIDDFDSFLDEERKKSLLVRSSAFEQLFLTTHVPLPLVDSTTRLRVKGGGVHPFS